MRDFVRGLPLLLVLALAAIPPADAADAGATSAEFHIGAAQLADALSQLGAQSGLQVVYAPEVARGLKSTALSGRLTVDAALQQLLAGTGITWSYINGDTVVLKRPEAKKDPPRKEQDKSTRNPASQEAAAALEEIVVSAQKREQRLQDVPIPVSVLSGDALASKDQVLLRDYSSLVPGFSVSPTQLGVQFLAIRGITSGGYDNPTVGVIIDDIPFGDPTGQAGNNFPDIDPGDLDRVEVLRGPQGTLYGAGSMGGLVKYVTKDPSTEGISGRIEAGTSDVYNGAEPGFNFRGAINVPVNDTLAFRISGFRREDPGYVDNPVLNRKGVNESFSDGGRLAALWRPSALFSVKLSALYQDTMANGSSDVDRVAGLKDFQQNYIASAGAFHNTVQAYSATLDYKLRSADLTSVTGYNVNRYKDYFDFTGFYGTTVQSQFGVGGARGTEFVNPSRFTQEIRVSTPLGQHFDWLAGVYYTHAQIPAFYILDAENPATGQLAGQEYNQYYPSAFQEYAGFTDLTYHVTDRFDVQIGGRESHLEITDKVGTDTGPLTRQTAPVINPEVQSKDNSFTYLLTPSFKISPDMMMYARLASGYRPGTINQAGAVAQGVAPNTKADKTQNYEVGFKGDLLDHKLSVDGSLYYIRWNNIPLVLFTPPPLILGYSKNVGEAKSEGVELAISSSPLTGLTASGWIDYDNAVLTQSFPAGASLFGVVGDRLPNTPRVSANVSLEKDFSLWNNATGFVGGVATYVGERVARFEAAGTDRQIYPEYTKIDLHVGGKLDTWTASLYANNVANKRGILSTNDFFAYETNYITPRTIGLKLVTTF